jgi:hypothetical protein
VGLNLRVADRSIMAARTVLDKTIRTAAAKNTLEMREGNLYLGFDAIPDTLTLYLDETMTPEGASSREAFVLVHGLPFDSYIKAGRILLPFGLRLPDDTVFVQQETGFTYANQDLALELGADLRPLSLAVAVSNGSLGGADTNTDKQLTGRAEVIHETGRAGFSFAYNDTSIKDFPYRTMTLGAHLGTRLGRLMLLGQAAFIRGSTGKDRTDRFALYTEADFEAYKGLYLRFMFEGMQPNLATKNNGRDRFVVGLSWFPIQFLELRGELRINRDIPQRVDGNANELVFELHGFL